MKWILTLIGIGVVGWLVFGTMNTAQNQATSQNEMEQTEQTTDQNTVYGVHIDPIEHASMVLTWNNTVLYVDPVGSADMYAQKAPPAIVLLTDIHGDHLNIDTVTAIVQPDTIIVAPQAVFGDLPEALQQQTTLLANGENTTIQEFSIEAVPMYNIPESEDTFHTKGRGNGYLVEKDGTRVYIAGDTSGTPEMRALTNIDIAFVPMNLPYTMDVDEAADAVIDFAPRTVIPYHYRGTDGLSDVAKFKELVHAANQNIDVLLLGWY